MFKLGADLKVYLHREPIDFRAGINSRCSLGNGIFSSAKFAQRCFPSTLEFGGDQTIIRVNAIELAFCQRRGVALALKLPFSASAQGLVDLLLCLPSPR
ncbi:hypothetical protein GUK30_38160 [Rhizobium leguminosarum]|uniref:hypothetical protein n=1 Tax=Rhizobium TaxID=379 RepID=UPI0013019F08|nr:MULTISPECIES: hypothetical protein [Rhizobium]MBB4346234.1 hypothetical protein [Rhizobium leguminosarum]MBB5262828.1 hypothetical protein [Rhizobium leguminosarum]MBB6299352.1 hypothetical protein [Rhizobium leguminosarum]MBX5069147.1 hypothetical protein [Rhizobium lentis]MBY5345731.1 transposase [Rhizobium leguminosarum]